LVQAQDPIDQLGKFAQNEAGKKGAVMRERLDSIDFQFAMSINDNAGFFDIEQKGETGSKLLYAMKSEDQKSQVERARDSLEVGLGMYEIRRYKRAEMRFVEVKKMMEENGLTKEITYLRTLSSLGLVALAQGKSAEAEVYITQTLADSKNSLGKESAAYVANLNNYAKLHQSMGKYNEAEAEFDEALQLCVKIFGGGMQKAIILNNKAMLSQVVGRYEEAVGLMKDAIAAADEAPKKMLQGRKSFDNRKFQANLATIYQLSKRYEDASRDYEEIKKVFDNRKQTNNAEYAGLLNQMGILYIEMKKNDRVEELLTGSAAIYKKRYTENNIYFAKVCNDLGNFYRQNGRFEDAEKQLGKAFTIREALLNPSHPDFVRTQEDLAILYWKTNRAEKAHNLYKDVMTKTIDFIDRYFPPMSEAEKTKYWDVLAPRFQRFYNFARENSQLNGISRDLYDYHIATKALLLSATSKVREMIMRSKDKALRDDYLRWVDQKEQLARMYAFSKKKLRDQNIDLNDLEQKANAMEKSLSSRSSEFSSGYATQRASFGQLQGLLSEGEAIVDIVRLKGFNQDFTDDVRYVAMIVRKDLPFPKIIVLDNGQQLETKFSKAYSVSMQKSLDDAFSYDQYWGRIEPEVKGSKLLYVSPDGVFNQINLNTLKAPGGEYLLNRYDMVVLGNSKDLIDIKKRAAGSASKTAFLFGYPDYREGITPLPGTKVEIETVSGVLKSSGYQLTQFTQGQATEKNIKTLKGPSLVHIATHGYFKKDKEENVEGSVYGISAENASNNPLLRSGLILSGAEKSVTGEGAEFGDEDNGILTAYEAMNLNLDGTNLVVLSACETGLGDVKSGEGVYGLQRAFLVAGARSLVMSLWKVDDAATQTLMTNFYNNWVKLGNSQKAFKQAQLDLMTKYKEPYYWGAFVLIGM
jgi:CHAT domain-containing protein/Tfp pilus assembly protein PilF